MQVTHTTLEVSTLDIRKLEQLLPRNFTTQIFILATISSYSVSSTNEEAGITTSGSIFKYGEFQSSLEHS